MSRFFAGVLPLLRTTNSIGENGWWDYFNTINAHVGALSDLQGLTHGKPLQVGENRIDHANNNQTDLKNDRWGEVAFLIGACLLCLFYPLCLYGVDRFAERDFGVVQGGSKYLLLVSGAGGMALGTILMLIGPSIL